MYSKHQLWPERKIHWLHVFVIVMWAHPIMYHIFKSKDGKKYLDLSNVAGGSFNPLTAKLFNLNFHLHVLEVVSRWRDSQLQVNENYTKIWQNGVQLFSNLAGWCHILSLKYLKCGTLCANKKWKPEHMRHRRLKGWPPQKGPLYML